MNLMFPGANEWIFILLIGVIWLWALVDCLRSEFKNDSKLLWTLLIMLLPFFGVVLYYVIGRSQRVVAVK